MTDVKKGYKQEQVPSPQQELPVHYTLQPHCGLAQILSGAGAAATHVSNATQQSGVETVEVNEICFSVALHCLWVLSCIIIAFRIFAFL